MSTLDRIVDEPNEELDKRLQELQSQEQQISTDNLEKEIQDSIPEKYRGKSVEDLIQMHSEAEKLIGRQGTELGDLRSKVDKILYNQELATTTDNQTVENDSENEFDLLEPEKSVDDRISKHPSVKRIEQLERNLAKQSFEKKHPDWQNKVGTQEFVDWVVSNPSRVRLYQEADSENWNSATDLLDQWAEWQGVVQKAAEQEANLRKESEEKALNDGMTESGTSTATSKKKFRKHELRRLYNEDRERYDAMQPEIMLAYQEGRVID